MNFEYIANQGSNTITIRDFDQQFTLDVADAPTGIAVTPEGDSIFVTHLNSNMVGQIEFTENSENHGYSEEFLCPTGDQPTAVAIALSVGLEGPDPESPMGDGNGSLSNSCALASPGAAPSIPLYLLIPAFILINRLWRRRTN